ncbi:MAG: cache domain-containing protein, partial [Pyrinomonadaceae bacterium]|nr:cache domain-containing protein [Phycisphaerales bacterium]
MTRPVLRVSSRPASDSTNRARHAFLAARFVAFLGLAIVGAAGWMLFHPGSETTQAEATAVEVLTEAGNSIRNDIERAVRPAMNRTSKLAHDPDVIAALTTGKHEQLAELVNRAIASSTEIDVIGVFDEAGGILAINTIHASGLPIEPERVEKLLGMSFEKKAGIKHCLRSDLDTPALEFQTTCAITPVFFDSTGLAVAYTEPVQDPVTGRKIGMISTRLRFERLSSLLEGRKIIGREKS